MKPIETEQTNFTFVLQGGSAENDLPVFAAHDPNHAPVLVSTWELDDAERQAVAAGANVELYVWGSGHPPVLVRVVGT